MMEVYITHHAGASNEDFGNYEISFTDSDNLQHSVSTKFDFKQLWSLARDIQSVAFDFLVFSTIIYNVDRSINRRKFSVDGWRRQLHVMNIPAVHVEVMNSVQEDLQNAISFLTGDDWELHFVEAAPYEYEPRDADLYNVEDYAKVSLFSGGLDSLIGFVNEASSLDIGQKILLISHKEQGKEAADQSSILSICRANRYFENKYTQITVNAGLRPSTWIHNVPSEGTFRSRSLLFFAMAIYAAHRISDDMPVIVPENGTISINIPLDKGRRSACSTRTTHPTFMNRIQGVLERLGIHNRLINPYKLKSKADMMEECCSDVQRMNILEHLYKPSCSCAKRSHNRWWDHRGGDIHHCGKCLPCIYRRVALDKVGWDDEESLGIDIFNSRHFDIRNKKQQCSNDMRALLRFLKSGYNDESIAMELRLNGITNYAEIQEYIQLVRRSYDQVRDWISRKGDENYKRLAGIV